jgi:hypothetical protein
MHHHTDGHITDDPLVGACWDADRLDLPRVGIAPDPRYLSTQAGRSEQIIRATGDPDRTVPTWEELMAWSS